MEDAKGSDEEEEDAWLGSEEATVVSEEVRRRLEEREAGRRSGHEAFIRVTAEHAQLLQDTIDNAITAKDVEIGRAHV